MNIEKTVRKDLGAIMALIGEVVRDMESQGIDQWNEHYPTENDFEEDLMKEALYVLRKGDALLGVIAFDEEQAPEYGQIDWLSKDKPVLVIHRLAVAPAHQGKGYAGVLMTFTERYAKAHGYGAIRLDAYTGNAKTIRFYENRGYVLTGEIRFPWRILPFNCYERVL